MQSADFTYYAIRLLSVIHPAAFYSYRKRMLTLGRAIWNTQTCSRSRTRLILATSTKLWTPAGLSLEIVNSAAYSGAGSGFTTWSLQTLATDHHRQQLQHESSPTRWQLRAGHCLRVGGHCLCEGIYTRHIPDWGPVARILSMMSITQ